MRYLWRVDKKKNRLKSDELRSQLMGIFKGAT